MTATTSLRVSLPGTGALIVAGVWRRTLTMAEVLRIAHNPRLLFKPRFPFTRTSRGSMRRRRKSRVVR